MSGPFDFRPGQPADEPEIRALVGSVAMPGDVAVRFVREPDYFLGTTIMGDPCEVLVARNRPDGRLAGIACRAERRSFINGEEQTTGYLGQIRVAEEFRGNWLIQRGARIVRERSRPGLIYLGVIARENPRARGALIERRPPAGLHAVRLSGLTTCAIILREHRRPPGAEEGIMVGPATQALLPQIVAFLRGHGPDRHFFPAYTLEDFTGGIALRGLAVEDILVAHRGDRILGVLAVWDQSAYKQDVVAGYGPKLERIRPAYDAAARFLKMRPLTPPGEAIPLAFGACISIAEDDHTVMHALVRAAAHHAVALGKAYLMLGFADSDPLLQVALRWPHITYRSDIFALSWSVDPAKVLDRRLPYVEVATL